MLTLERCFLLLLLLLLLSRHGYLPNLLGGSASFLGSLGAFGGAIVYFCV